MHDTRSPVVLEEVRFDDLPGWPDDDHLAAYQAFVSSAPALLNAGSARFAGICRAMLAATDFPPDSETARRFFESRFTPFKVVHHESDGLLTGYYEPELCGSRERSSEFTVPVLARPPDLVNLVEESERGALSERMTHARSGTDGELCAYSTRKEIDEGALAGQGLELLFLADDVDLFFMQVQGSGLIRLTDGSSLRLIYAGKNGHRYTSIGRHLIETGVFSPEAMNLQALIDWLKADLERARAVLWRNESYVFFRVLGPEDETRPLGTNEIPLTPLRSLAVDTAFYELGQPIFVCAPGLDHIVADASGFNRLMVAHDVGSAIKGAERGDVFCGSGLLAGVKAGMTKHPVNFFALVPK
jgi:membrane-bound lytic murein transglycosylase A